MLNVQKYLLSKSLNDLQIEHGVYARWSLKNKCKFSLNYDQLEVKDSEIISQECRGLVLECDPSIAGNNFIVVGQTKILAHGMNRFFNYGQESAAKIDFDCKETKILSKEDGTMIILYHDPVLKEWSCATRSVSDADLIVNGFEGTFTDLFWKACTRTTKLSKEAFCGLLQPSNTYVFELCAPDNQVVVYYKEYTIFLLTVRNISIGKELKQDMYKDLLSFVPTPIEYRFGNITEMIDYVSSQNPSEFEGTVVCDKNFNRVKVKNPGYMALSRIKDSVTKSPRALVEIILLEKEDDIIPMVPDHIKEKITETKEKIAFWIKKNDSDYLNLYNEDRKTFALAIKANGANMAYCMSRYMGQCSTIKEWIKHNRQKDGSWSNSFLDFILSWIK